MARAFHGISLAASWPWNSGKREMVHHMQKGTYSTAAGPVCGAVEGADRTRGAPSAHTS